VKFTFSEAKRWQLDLKKLGTPMTLGNAIWKINYKKIKIPSGNFERGGQVLVHTAKPPSHKPSL